MIDVEIIENKVIVETDFQIFEYEFEEESLPDEGEDKNKK